jgi:hypothetical protein
MPVDLSVADAIPEDSFCNRLIDAQLSRDSDVRCGPALPCPSPAAQERGDLSPQ